MVRRQTNNFFYDKRGQEDTAIGPKQLLYLIIIIGLLLILLAVISLMKKTILK